MISAAGRHHATPPRLPITRRDLRGAFHGDAGHAGITADRVHAHTYAMTRPTPPTREYNMSYRLIL